MDHYNNYLSIDAIIMVSNKYTVNSEQVLVIVMTLHVTIIIV